MRKPSSRPAVLVTGGAGYIGSFTVRALAARGVPVVVLDDLSRGHRGALPRGIPLVAARVQEHGRVRRLLRSRPFSAVVHFAAFAYVAESVEDPWKYRENNILGTAALLEEMIDAGVRAFVFSSSCAVYGVPRGSRIRETAPRAPVSPYGETKASSEALLERLEEAGGIRSFRLRYFNAAGAAADGSIGEDHDPEPHLIPRALGAASKGTSLKVFGADYPTPDGTCVRDYVHVEDLAEAHVAAVERLARGRPGGALNLGTGRGHSVLEVARTVGEVTGRPVRTRVVARRPGDPPFLVAAPGRAKSVLGWEPRHGTLRSIVATAWEWHRRHPEGYGGRA